jgi:hypothetical protein
VSCNSLTNDNLPEGGLSACDGLEVELEWAESDAVDLELYILDESDEVVEYSEAFGNAEAVNFPIEHPDGTYYIAITYYTGSTSPVSWDFTIIGDDNEFDNYTGTSQAGDLKQKVLCVEKSGHNFIVSQI